APVGRGDPPGRSPARERAGRRDGGRAGRGLSGRRPGGGPVGVHICVGRRAERAAATGPVQSQVGVAGMGPGAGPTPAGLSRDRPQRARSRPGVHRRGRRPGRGALDRAGPLASGGGEGGRDRRDLTETPETTEISNQHAGFAAIIGAPNAGKSTLVNRLTGSKVSIVTQKVQTTRFPVRGIAIEGDAQIVLVDTPGVFTPRRRLDRAMVASAWAGAQDADVAVHLVDAQSHIDAEGREGTPADRRSAEDTETIIANLKATDTKVILALNKIDGMRRDTLLALSQAMFETGVYSEVYMISALSGDGVDDLKQRLARAMPPGPWLYPADQSADVPMRVLAAEITREKVYLRVHEELPYSAAVETTAFEDRPDGSARIEQTIYVERESQRPIVLGKGGQTLKWIGQKSREELTELLDRPVHLFLTVKVDPKWQDSKALYAQFGLDYDV